MLLILLSAFCLLFSKHYALQRAMLMDECDFFFFKQTEDTCVFGIRLWEFSTWRNGIFGASATGQHAVRHAFLESRLEAGQRIMQYWNNEIKSLVVKLWGGLSGFWQLAHIKTSTTEPLPTLTVLSGHKKGKCPRNLSWSLQWPLENGLGGAAD